MKIVLLSPKGPLYRHQGGIFRKSLRAAPLTLTTLASLIPPECNATVRIIDEGIAPIPNEIDADIIGMTVITGSAPRSYELADHFRKQRTPVVLGGPHVTLMPEEAQQHADAIVTGYAEDTWPQLLRDLAAGCMQPRYDMQPDFSLNRSTPLPFPRRDLLPSRSYKTKNTFEATRGCVHQCSFCVVPTAWGRRPFLKPVDHVIADIRQCRARHAVFYDLNLVANRRYAYDLFEAMVPLNIPWFGLASTLLDDELIEVMARSGCRGLLIGFESLNQDALNDGNKKWNRPQRYRDLINKLRSVGIAVNGTFMFGLDSDGLDVFDNVAEFVLEQRIELPRFSILTPFPSTPLHHQLKNEGRITESDWSRYDGQHVVFEPKRMSRDQLLQGHAKAWKQVYSRKGIAHRIIARIHRRLDMIPVLIAANWGYRYYAHRLSRFYTCDGGAAFT